MGLLIGTTGGENIEDVIRRRRIRRMRDPMEIDIKDTYRKVYVYPRIDLVREIKFFPHVTGHENEINELLKKGWIIIYMYGWSIILGKE